MNKDRIGDRKFILTQDELEQLLINQEILMQMLETEGETEETIEVEFDMEHIEMALDSFSEVVNPSIQLRGDGFKMQLTK